MYCAASRKYVFSRPLASVGVIELIVRHVRDAPSAAVQSALNAITMQFATVGVIASEGAPDATLVFVSDESTPAVDPIVSTFPPKKFEPPDRVNVTVIPVLAPGVVVHTLSQQYDPTLTTCSCTHVVAAPLLEIVAASPWSAPATIATSTSPAEVSNVAVVFGDAVL